MSKKNKTLVPQSKAALDRMKHETARDVGVNLEEEYNGNISAKDAGKVGGQMVKRLIEKAERQATNNNKK